MSKKSKPTVTNCGLMKEIVHELTQPMLKKSTILEMDSIYSMDNDNIHALLPIDNDNIHALLPINRQEERSFELTMSLDVELI